MPVTLEPNPTADQLLLTIFGAINKIADERNIDLLLIRLADLGRDLVSAERCTVWMLDNRRDMLWSRAAHGLDRIEVPCQNGICGHVVITGESLIINAPYNDSRFDQNIDRQTGFITKNLLALPIKDSSGAIIGVIQAVNKRSGTGQFTEEDKGYLLLAAVYTGKEIEAGLLQEELETTQREIIFTLAETGEMRSKETGNHVRRVAEYSFLLAKEYGLNDLECDVLRYASPLHDIGKIAIPDAILLKPAPLGPEERAIMQRHTTLGYEILKHSDRKILKAAAIIAHQHHEKWNGQGYPNGLEEEGTHIYGRITAVADVFDALASDRYYKKAWELDRVLELFREERGGHFDPELTDILFDNIAVFKSIREKYKDEMSSEPQEQGSHRFQSELALAMNF